MSKESSGVIINAENLQKQYEGDSGKFHALDNVSINLKEGDFLAVSGPSGSGKSTLLLTLGVLLKPDHGDITFDGEDPYLLSASGRAAFRAKQIGFVFQDFHLIPYLNVKDNVLCPSITTPDDAYGDRAKSLLSDLCLIDRLGHLPEQLSSGEKQRAALARALLPRPKVIFADEPTGNLDQENSSRVLKCLSDYADSGSAVLMATHDDAAMSAANKHALMDSGKLASLSN